ncbi:hypothetical protein JH06_5165 [Blastocystis sp. subtype 4]|uniref:hypothetical protein n=1 Tax=Blastocystis sp. subtype 4 TaxID=944170 RepID=UPI000711B320|nr:hypothetical protein JH06_5165 [Blastocystis sp. subtype 4]KNB41444.1 hypothetical protein JH06_5165 [Blastocystis sp. subtype 4]|eukprot:XP_014524887.1 hypothetical protein JH06_5165 [Blastocystis sp. subtype 4]
MSAADQAAIDKRLTFMEVKDMAVTANKVVEMCFRDCAKNFRSKELDKKESDCIRNCAGKYMELTNRIYRRYQEIQTSNSTPTTQ